MDNRMIKSDPILRRVASYGCFLLLSCTLSTSLHAQDHDGSDNVLLEEQEQPSASPALMPSPQATGDAQDPFQVEPHHAQANQGQSSEEEPMPAALRVRSVQYGPQPQRVETASSEATKAFRKLMETYHDEVKDLDETVQQMITAEYRSRRAVIEDYFQAEVEAQRVEERALRSRAIDEFQAFLDRFPDHPQHTPDVLFRLAELYYEQTEDQFILDDLAYEDQYQQYEEGRIPSPPDPVEKDFSHSIALFQRLVHDFPDYRQVDGAWYLLGICQLQMDEDEDALQSFQTLVYNYPDSQFAQEGYLRIGEEYFGIKDFKLAQPAYKRALLYGDSVWYDKIMFKLGWSNYLLNDYDSAIHNFLGLLEYYEAKADRSQQAVREEALQYTAITLGEQDWDLDGETDDDFIMPRVLHYLGEDKSYTADVLDRLAKIFSEYAEGGGSEFYSMSEVEVLEHALERWPTDPKNPERHNEIIAALFRANKIDEALEEGQVFIDRYAMGTPWYQAQEKNGRYEEIAFAETTSRSLLIEHGVALYMEAEGLAATAIEKNDLAIAEEARKRYRAAASAFEHYLDAYPNGAEVYDARMYMAQSLLNSGEYYAAGRALGAVRDSELSTKYRNVAATLAIDAFQQALIQAISNGELEARAFPPYVAPDPKDDKKSSKDKSKKGDDAGDARSAPANEPIPELSLEWVEASDRYIELGIKGDDPEDDDMPAQLAFSTAKLFYDYHHYDTAIERLQDIIRGYCGKKETGFAAALLINTYRLQGDYASVEKWSNEVQRMGDCVKVPENLAKQFAEDLEKYKMGAVADKAEKYYAEGKYKEAAEEYERLTTDYSDSAFAPLGLYNAGMIYEHDLREYRRAMDAFEELIKRYPKSEYVDPALVRVAVNAMNAFDFDKAIATFFELDKRGYTDDNAASPLLSAAEQLENTQQYSRAADAYLQFVKKNPRAPQAPAALFNAAQVYDKGGDHRKALETFAKYRKSYGGVTNALIDGDLAVLTSYVRERELAEENRDTRQVAALNKTILSEFEKRRPKPTPGTWANVQYVVGEILYDQARESFQAWDKESLGTKVETQQKRIKARIDAMPALREEFNNVVIAGSADWTICAKYQQGLIYKTMSDRVARLPVPEFPSMEAEDMYFSGTPDGSWPGIDAIIRQWEDQALKDWSEDGYPVAQRSGVYNECARSMLAELNRVYPDQYPVYRTELRAHGNHAFSPSTIVTPPARIVQGATNLGERPVEDEEDQQDIDIDFGDMN